MSFGRYEQDGDEANGPELIEWLVPDTDDGTATLISRYVLHAARYNGSALDIGYLANQYRSDIYKWMNGEFANEAFTQSELAMLETGDGQAATLLSVDDANRCFSSDSDRVCLATAEAVARGAALDSSGVANWWLTTPGRVNSTKAAIVRYDGEVDADGVSIQLKEGVRPVIRLRLAELP